MGDLLPATGGSGTCGAPAGRGNGAARLPEALTYPTPSPDSGRPACGALAAPRCGCGAAALLSGGGGAGEDGPFAMSAARPLRQTQRANQCIAVPLLQAL